VVMNLLTSVILGVFIYFIMMSCVHLYHPRAIILILARTIFFLRGGHLRGDDAHLVHPRSAPHYPRRHAIPIMVI